MKFLHISDVHFGRPFLSKDNGKRGRMIENQYRTFDRVINFLIQEKIDALLIAGDLFDHENRPLRSERYLLKQFNRLQDAGIFVFYALGNHDSNMTFKSGFLRKLPENVIIFNEKEPTAYCFKEKVYIHSCGHQEKNDTRRLLPLFNEPAKGYINVGLLHCSITSKAHDNTGYLPTELQTLKDKGYDYWALGHIHKRERLDQSIYYCGSLMGLSSKETGSKGGFLVDFSAGLDVSFIPFSTFEYQSLVIDLSKEHFETIYDLLDYVESKINTNKKEIYLSLKLKGDSHLYHVFKDSEQVQEIQRELFNIDSLVDMRLDTEALKPEIDLESYITKDNILGYIHKEFSNQQALDALEKKYKDRFNWEKLYYELMEKMVKPYENK